MSEFRAAAATDVGVLRSSNQDSFLVTDDLFAVADGMGGHNGGEVASKIAIETLRDAVSRPDTDVFVDAFQIANQSIREKAGADPTLTGMGTTLVAIARVDSDDGDMLALANVGDSRCYLLDGEHLTQYTRDHSLVQTLVDSGQITYVEAESHPQRNILTRALGIDVRVMTDSWELAPVAGDRWLMCSDGLFNEVSEDEICDLLRSEPNPSEAAATLVQMANDGGGRDNITVVIVDVVDDTGAVPKGEGHSRVVTAVTGGHRALVDADTVERKPPGVTQAEEDDPTIEGPVVATGSQAEVAEGESVDDAADVVVDDRSGDDDGPDSAATAASAAGAPLERARGPVTFRSILFVAVLVMVLVAVVGVVAFASRSTYYVGFDDDEVTIYRGRPGGFLWFDPTVQERTGIARDDVPASFLDELEPGKEESSLDDAQSYVNRIQVELDDEAAGGNAPATTRPTTSTVPSTTTVPPVTTASDTTPEPTL